MDATDILNFLSVADAFRILREHKSVTSSSIKFICEKCNIPYNKITHGRLTRKFTNVYSPGTCPCRSKGNILLHSFTQLVICVEVNYTRINVLLFKEF